MWCGRGTIWRSSRFARSVVGAALLASIAVAVLAHRLTSGRGPVPAPQDGGPAGGPASATALFLVANDRSEWGYIDASGVVRIAPRFRRAEPFAEGLAAVEADSGWGFIDEAGRFVIDPKLHTAQSFSEGRAPATWGTAAGEARGFVDRTGGLVELAGPYDDLGPLHEGIARACRTRLHVGFIDRRGRFAVEPRFHEVRDFHEGFAAVGVWVMTFIPPAGSRSGRSEFDSRMLWGYVRRDGSYLVPPRFIEARDFHEGRAVVRCDDHQYGYIDTRGELVIPCELRSAVDYERGVGAGETETGVRLIHDKPLPPGFDRLVHWDAKGGRLESLTGQIRSPLIGQTFAFIGPFSGGLAVLRRADGSVGAMDERGQLVMPFRPMGSDGPLFSRVDPAFSEGLLHFSVGAGCHTRHGFLSTSGAVAIEPRYASAGAFSEGLAAVCVDPEDPDPHDCERSDAPPHICSFIDGAGRVVMAGSDGERSFHAGLAAVPLVDETHTRSLVGYIDRTGKAAIAPAFGDAGDFGDDGLAWASLPVGCDGVRADGSFAFRLPPLIEPRTPKSPPEPRLLVMSNGPSYGYWDLSGHVAIPPKFGWASPFAEGLAAAIRRPSPKGAFPPRSVGFIDARGEFVIAPSFDPMSAWLGDAPVFSEDRAAVMVDGAVGFIDREGRWVVRPRYESAGCFRQALAPVKREGRWGFVDRDGQEIVAPRFDTVEGFSEGRAAVTVHEKWGYVDRNGHFVIEPRYEKALPFRQGIACVTESETAPEAAAPRLRSSYIDAKGNVLWSAAHDFCDLRHDERPCIRRHRGSAGW